jgi:hypothetical protein
MENPIVRTVVEAIAESDKAFAGLHCAGIMTTESSDRFAKAIKEIQCTWVFLEEWLEQHRRLIRHAYRAEKIVFLYWKALHYPYEVKVFKMTKELRDLCTKYLEMRKTVRG